MAYSAASVQAAWDNHFAAFGAQDLDKIMLDYGDDSLVRMHNNVTGETEQFKGLFEIRTMFAGLFGDLKDLSTLSAPVINVDENEKQVFLVWKCPGCGYDTATDTFVFAGKENKIVRQNIVVTQTKQPAEGYFASTVQAAWDNHFAAFGAQDLDKIMLDYDETSVVRVHNNVTAETSEFKGLAGVRTMFTNLFADLSDLSTLSAPVINVDENEKQVFLVWKCPGCGYDTATDTFVFGKGNKIVRQNIVATHTKQPPKEGYFAATVQAAWDNHFAAFGAQDLDKIMLDYSESSVVRVHNNVTAETSEHKGLAGVREMFTSLFANLKDLSSLSAPVIKVDENEKQVFLVWKCPGCGYDAATDTFVFAGKDNKIVRQNIVVTFKKPA